MAGNILDAALTQYGLGTGSPPNTKPSDVKNPQAQYEYGQSGRLGIDTDGDGFREVDCSALVYNAMRNAGYYLPNSSTAKFTTRTLFNGDDLTPDAKQYFTALDAKAVLSQSAEIKPGDVLLFNGVNGNTSQHTGIFYGYDDKGQPMFYGSQTSTGPGVVTLDLQKDSSYWNGGSFKLVGAVRPNESIYVPQMDLTGGADTGLGSPSVVAAVNLLKQSNVEGYRANIYSHVDGVPTVGNGLALVVKGVGGVWQTLPENQIKDLLRDAGLPESKWSELPLSKLSESAALLNQGNKAQAKALFGAGSDDGFSLSPAEADKLTAAYVVRDVVSKVVNRLGGAEEFDNMAPGQFAAVASKVYQSPGWLGTSAGSAFVKAWKVENLEDAQAALGSGNRAQAEAAAYAGHISTTNEHLSSSAPAEPKPSGHWEDSTQYDAMGNVMVPGERVWVSDAPTPSPASSAPAPTPPAPPGPAGDSVDAPLPDGTRIVSTSVTQNGQTTVTAQLLDASGRVLLSAGPGQTMERDPETGVVQVRTGDSSQVQQYDPATGQVSDIEQLDKPSLDPASGLTPAPVPTPAPNPELDALLDSLKDTKTLPSFGPGIQIADVGALTGAGTLSDAGAGVGLPAASHPPAPATGQEIISVKETTAPDGSRSITVTKANGHVEESRYAVVDGQQVLQFSTYLSVNPDGTASRTITYGNGSTASIVVDSQGEAVRVLGDTGFLTTQIQGGQRPSPAGP